MQNIRAVRCLIARVLHSVEMGMEVPLTPPGHKSSQRSVPRTELLLSHRGPALKPHKNFRGMSRLEVHPQRVSYKRMRPLLARTELPSVHRENDEGSNHQLAAHNPKPISGTCNIYSTTRHPLQTSVIRENIRQESPESPAALKLLQQNRSSLVQWLPFCSTGVSPARSLYVLQRDVVQKLARGIVKRCRC